MLKIDFLDRLRNLYNPTLLPFYAVEGIDGSGKTTYCKQLVANLVGQGKLAIYTKEPTNGILRYDLHGFIEDRIYHSRQITDLLNDGFIVICDRYDWSTLAYQDMGELAQEYFLTNYPNWIHPKQYICLDVPVMTAIERIKKRNNFSSPFENIEQLRTARRRYHQLLSHF